MPTGYTAGIQSGEIKTLRQYALTCVRAFGATYFMRDEPFDAPIPDEVKPNTQYEDEQIERAQQTIARVDAMTDAECELAAETEYREERQRADEHNAKDAATKKRYQEMINAASAWVVPNELFELRDFMISQIRESMRFDCDHDYGAGLVKRTGKQWREYKLKDARWTLQRNADERAKTIKRAEENTAWLKLLRKSLEGLE